MEADAFEMLCSIRFVYKEKGAHVIFSQLNSNESDVLTPDMLTGT